MMIDPDRLNDPTQMDARMAACEQFLRQRLNARRDVCSTAPDAVPGLVDEVRRAIYRDYSLWNNELDKVERIVARMLGEYQRRDTGWQAGSSA